MPISGSFAWYLQLPSLDIVLMDKYQQYLGRPVGKQAYLPIGLIRFFIRFKIFIKMQKMMAQQLIDDILADLKASGFVRLQIYRTLSQIHSHQALLRFLRTIAAHVFIHQPLWIQIWPILINCQQQTKAEIARLAFQQGYFIKLAQLLSNQTGQVFEVVVEQFAADPQNHWIWDKQPFTSRWAKFYYYQFQKEESSILKRLTQSDDSDKIRNILKKTLANKTFDPLAKKKRQIYFKESHARQLLQKLVGELDHQNPLRNHALLRLAKQFGQFQAIQELSLYAMLTQSQVFYFCRFKLSRPQQKERIGLIYLASRVSLINRHLVAQQNQQYWKNYQEIALEVRLFYNEMLTIIPNSRKLVYAIADFQTFITKDLEGLSQTMEMQVSKDNCNFYDWKKYLFCLKSIGAFEKARDILQRAKKYGVGFEKDELEYNMIVGSFPSFRASYKNFYKQAKNEEKVHKIKQTEKQHSTKQEVKRQSESQQQKCTVFLKCIPRKYTNKDIAALVPELSLLDIRVVNKSNQLIAYIDCPSKKSAQAFIQALNGRQVQPGKKLYAAESRALNQMTCAVVVKGLKVNDQKQAIQMLEGIGHSKRITLLRNRKGVFFGTAVIQLENEADKEDFLTNGKGLNISAYESAEQRSVFIKNLPYQATSEAIANFFKQEQIEKVQVPRREGKGRGFGTVTFRLKQTKDKYLRLRSMIILGRRAQFYPSQKAKINQEKAPKQNKQFASLFV